MFRFISRALILVGLAALQTASGNDVFAADMPAGGSDRRGHNPQDLDQQALWSTPGDGRLVMLLRNTDDSDPDANPVFKTPIPVRVRICVTNMVGDSNSVNLFVWTTGGPQTTDSGLGAPTSQPMTLHPGLGECVEIDQPAAVIVQDSTINGSASGYYQLFGKTTLPPVIHTGQGHKGSHREVEIGDPDPKLNHADCRKLEGGDATKNYQVKCELKFANPPPEQNGARICTERGFVNPGSPFGPIKGTYPPGYLELTTPEAMTPKVVKDGKPSDYHPFWNPMTSMSCRDVFWKRDPGEKPFSRSIYFMAGPGPNQPDGGYKPKDMVQSLSLIVQPIKIRDIAN